MKMHDQARIRQKGVATLVVSVGVALLMAVAAVGMMRSGLLEQKIAANDIRAREAQEIAQAGLESIMASNYVPAQECEKDGKGVLDLKDDKLGSFNGVPSVPNGGDQQTSQEGYTHSIKGCEFEGRYFARSEVKLNAEPVKTEYFVEAWFQRSSLLNSDVGILSPFFINGEFCTVENCNNSGKVFNSVDRPGVIATKKISENINNVFKSGYDAMPVKTDSEILNGKSSAWGYIFSTSLADAKNMAISNPGKPFYYFENKENVNLSNLISSADAPIVLILDVEDASKCPNVSGGEIFGIVYISDACKANGWGNATIRGSIVSDGDIIKLTSNSAEYHGFSLSSWNKLKEANSDGVFVIPGTWKDF